MVWSPSCCDVGRPILPVQPVDIVRKWWLGEGTTFDRGFRDLVERFPDEVQSKAS
jgi:hypothetical protein